MKITLTKKEFKRILKKDSVFYGNKMEDLTDEQIREVIACSAILADDDFEVDIVQ